MSCTLLRPFDKGSYAKELLTGDVHSTTQKALGLDTRDLAKRLWHMLKSMVLELQN